MNIGHMAATSSSTDLAHTLAVVGGRGGLVQLLGGDQQLVLALLQVLLQALHSLPCTLDLL